MYLIEKSAYLSSVSTKIIQGQISRNFFHARGLLFFRHRVSFKYKRPSFLTIFIFKARSKKNKVNLRFLVRVEAKERFVQPSFIVGFSVKMLAKNIGVRRDLTKREELELEVWIQVC